MNVRRFVLRLAVGLLCFAVGWACAVLLGVAAPRRPEFKRRVRVEVVVPHVEVPDIEMPPPRFEFEAPSCGRKGMRHSHEWRDLPHLEEFETMRMELDEHLAPPPPPPPAPVRPRRGGS